MPVATWLLAVSCLIKIRLLYVAALQMGILLLLPDLLAFPVPFEQGTSWHTVPYSLVERIFCILLPV